MEELIWIICIIFNITFLLSQWDLFSKELKKKFNNPVFIAILMIITFCIVTAPFFAAFLIAYLLNTCIKILKKLQ